MKAKMRVRLKPIIAIHDDKEPDMRSPNSRMITIVERNNISDTMPKDGLILYRLMTFETDNK